MGVAQDSGIKVLDRAVAILCAVSHEPRSLAELCADTGLPRATAHRLASALETHRLLARSRDGRWSIGPMLIQFAEGSDALITAAGPILESLQAATNESVQLYRLTGTTRTCIAAREPEQGLNNIVPAGSQMPLTAGSAAKIFLAWAKPELREDVMSQARFTADDLDKVRSRGLAESVSEREIGLASVSAPVFDADGELLAALSVSGPADRLRPSPAAVCGKALASAAVELTRSL